MSLFRATGRFIWVPGYLVYLASLYIINKFTKNKIAILIVTICLIIQIIDFYPAMNEKYSYEEIEYSVDKITWEQMLNDKKHVVYLIFGQYSFDEARNEFYKAAYIANLNNCTLNNFYFARQVQNVEQTNNDYILQLKQGKIEQDVLYIIKQNSDNKWWNEELNEYEIDGYTVITSLS